MSKIRREIGLVALLAAVVFGPAVVVGQGGAAQPPAGFPDLVGALKATPGVLGVETAQSSTGKQVIFAWFENKKAALNWYYSDVHQQLVKQYFPTVPAARKPMADVPDDNEPILAIASLTMAEKSASGVTSLPVSQIAIELYRPLPGGLAVGGRFAPATVKVPGLFVVPTTTKPPERFDLAVRGDFFAGFAGDAARLQKGMDASEKVLAGNPKHAEALVWHGSGLAYQAGMAFQKGDMQTGGELWTRGLKEMDTAVELAPDEVGVRIPRGAVLLTASRNMPPQTATPLVEKGLADYEHVLEIQTPYFATLGDHPKGELLFGLAEGYSRLGNLEKARTYFDRLIKDAPASGQAPKAKTWIETGTLPKRAGLGCVGCHK